MKTIGWLIAIACLLTGSACQQILPTKQAQLEPLLYRDDFSDPQSGWTAAGSANGAAGYADGVYRIRVDQANSDVWASPGLELAEARIEVDALKVGGDRNNRFGIVCRSSPGRFYIFLISSDGYYGIGKVIDNQYQLLGNTALLPDDSIPKGSAYLHLRADCVQDNLRLFVNGNKIAEVRDGDLRTGDVGLVAGAYSANGTDILFDNFQVFQP